MSNQKVKQTKTNQLDIPKIIRAASKYGVKKLKIGEVEIEFDETINASANITTEPVKRVSKVWTPQADEIAMESEDDHDSKLEEERIAQLDLFDPAAFEAHILKDGTDEN